MSPLTITLLVLGTLFALAGVVLFAKMGTGGENRLRILGAEFHLSGSALVIVLMGAALIWLGVQHERERPDDSRHPDDVAVVDPVDTTDNGSSGGEPPAATEPRYEEGRRARMAIEEIRAALTLYHTEHGVYPDELSELAVDSAVTTLGADQIRYRRDPESGYVLLFAYADHALGTPDDRIYRGRN